MLIINLNESLSLWRNHPSGKQSWIKAKRKGVKFDWSPGYGPLRRENAGAQSLLSQSSFCLPQRLAPAFRPRKHTLVSCGSAFAGGTCEGLQKLIALREGVAWCPKRGWAMT
jgi:hypothetical protein